MIFSKNSAHILAFFCFAYASQTHTESFMQQVKSHIGNTFSQPRFYKALVLDAGVYTVGGLACNHYFHAQMATLYNIIISVAHLKNFACFVYDQRAEDTASLTLSLTNDIANSALLYAVQHVYSRLKKNKTSTQEKTA